uniref:Reverse transcriptase domain-containing protein n=1 Tax=Tanacetum cinerariifolium TaxID=118510 RepID=A0A6L2NED5_TANCI|nr:reverse transcriptase domain-containing protein [Tanacetum cinerariifolium]
MRTRSSSNLPVVSPPNPSTSNPKRHNRRRSKQHFILEESPIDTMADQCTMAELLRAPTEGYAEAIVVPSILVEQFELKHTTPPPTSVKAVEKIYVTYGGAHPYYQYLATGGNTFPELRDNIQRYVAVPIVNYNQELLRAPTEGYAEAIVVPSILVEQFELKHTTPPPTSVKAVEKIYVTYGGAHPYYQYLATGGNTFPELRDNIQRYVAVPIVNYNQGNSVYRPPVMANQIRPSGSGSLPSNTIANPKGELKAITTRSGIVLDGPSDLAEYTIKVPPPLVQKSKPLSQRDFVLHQRDPLYPNIPYPSRMLKQKQQEKDEVQIHKFWQMFKQLHINITLADALILMSKYQKMLKALLSNKEKLQELANTPLNENCSAVILKKLTEKLRDLGKFLILCGFKELKCKVLADLGASINLMLFSAWKKLGLPELISTRMTLELANRAICIPTRMARDVFVPIGKFAFTADFVIVDYESDPRVPLILGRPFLQTAHALIDVHGEEMILRDDLDSIKDLHPPHHVNPLSGITTYASSPNQLLEEFVDELALITFPLGNDDLQFDIDNLADLNDNLVDSMPEMFTDEHALDYSSYLLYDEYDDDLFEVESDTKNVYDDAFDSKGEKIKESKLLIYELDLPYDFLLPFECDSILSEDFSKVDALPSTNNEDKVFNPGILIQENLFDNITHVALEKKDKKLTISHASLMLEDFDPPLYELPCFKEVPSSKILLLFSSKNEKKVFKPGIHTSGKVYSSFIPELSH